MFIQQLRATSGIYFTLVLLILSVWYIYPFHAAVSSVFEIDKQEFISVLTNSSSVDTYWFWQWRDATNGSFAFDASTTRIGMTRRMKTDLPEKALLHQFRSRTVVYSDDLLYRSDSDRNSVLDQFMHSGDDDTLHLLKRGNDFLLYENIYDNSVVLYFVKDANNLIGVDGLFDFLDFEKELLKNRFWINTTLVK
jgi:hypothetical protein